MKKCCLFLSFLFIFSCQMTKELPCEGNEEQIFRCQSLRNQERQLRGMNYLRMQQNQQIWNAYNQKFVN